MNIYVGNLHDSVTDEDLKTAFEEHGKVETAKVINDRFSGVSRGFGFVEMPIRDEAKMALVNLNGKELKGKNILISEARPRKDNRGGGKGKRW